MGDMTREPSMEDILSSIRRVIARDEAPGAPRGPSVTQNDVLELQDEESGDDSLAPATSDLGDEGVDVPVAAPAPVDELVSAQSAEAARHSLEALTAVLPTPTPSVAGAGRSMEDVVVDALRPMLKQWLDQNLPEMVEAMVAREISRITGRRF